MTRLPSGLNFPSVWSQVLHATDPSAPRSALHEPASSTEVVPVTQPSTESPPMLRKLPTWPPIPFDVTQDPYALDRLIARGNYYNPPALAFMHSPLAAMNFKNAFWTFSAFSIAALAGFIGLTWWSGRGIPELPLLVLGILTFRPVHEALIMGHSALFFCLALTAGFLLLRARHEVLAGLCFSLLALVGTSHAAAAGHDGMPSLNVRPACQGVVNEDLDLQEKPTLETCLREEQDARKTLQAGWSGYPARDRSTCVGETQIGGLPSYVELLGCLQDAQTARDLERSARTPAPAH